MAFDEVNKRMLVFGGQLAEGSSREICYRVDLASRSDCVKDFRPGSSVGPRDVVARRLHAMIVSAGRWETSRRCKAASVRLRLSETVEPARIRSDAPVVINRHFETTASVDRKRRPWLRD